jgi:hypothetical protein
MKKGAFLKSHGIQTLQSETAKRMFLDSNSPQINTDKHECFSEKLAQIAKNPFYLRLHLHSPALAPGASVRAVQVSVVKKVNFKTLS